MSVYFVTCREANAVKIGYSGDASVRVKEIQCGCPFPVKLEAIMPGTITVEHQLHAAFADDRMCGEWFKINPVIEAMIAASPAPEPEPKLNKYYRAPSFNTLVGRVRHHLLVSQPVLAGMLDIKVDVLRTYERDWNGRVKLPPALEARLLALLPSEQAA